MVNFAQQVLSLTNAFTVMYDGESFLLLKNFKHALPGYTRILYYITITFLLYLNGKSVFSVIDIYLA